MMTARLPLAATTVGFALLLYFLVISPLSQWRNDSLSGLLSVEYERQQLTQSIARLLAERENYAREDLTSVMWQASQIAQATARVQSALNDVARRNGIPMRSISPIDSQSMASENTIAFRLEFEASLDQLVPFLRHVEFEQPVLVVTRANMRRLVRPNEVTHQPHLLVQLDIAAPILLGIGASE